MKRPTKKAMIFVARKEIALWSPSVAPGLVLAILFAFIHHFTEGETVEETFFNSKPAAPDYEI